MARIRSLKPEIWMSPQVMNLAHDARLLFVGLITQADDEGKGTADPRRLKAAIFGGDDCTAADVRRMLDECSAQGLVEVYSSESHGLVYALPSWKSHQSIDRPRKSVYPSPTPRRTLDEGSSGIGGEWKGREGNGSGHVEGSTNARRIESPPQPPTRQPDEWTNGGTVPATLTDPERMDAFAVIRTKFPRRAGRGHNWILAERAWGQLIDDGTADPLTLELGVDRYRAYVEGGGVSSDAYVMGADQFFSAVDRPWSQMWELPTKLAAGNGRKTVAEKIAALGVPADDNIGKIS